MINNRTIFGQNWTLFNILDWKLSKTPKKIFYVLLLWFLLLSASHAGFTVQSLLTTGWMPLSSPLQCKFHNLLLCFFLFIFLDLPLSHALMVLHSLMPLQLKAKKAKQVACHLHSTQWLLVCCFSSSLLVLLSTFRFVKICLYWYEKLLFHNSWKLH